jgi:hypothetical protein
VRDVFVAAHLELSGGSNQWNVSFARAAHDWKVDTFASFFSLLYLASKRRKGEDKLWWTCSKKELFNVRSFYNDMICIDDSPFS